ncbi:membrane-bound metal-dependent hydrolase [Methanoregula boonei 6A8]|uniref:Membrane-bound metal-dependent hydrolase n=1 Tax=Methanoregula boonei (strain DSM 21154 / JCM 14090 / 6A8) TaxID=456442 RepID=A7IAP5_METB6|nr:metal-dependent hydrolase [Methanoregula boonei]ABS56806.1 membrane-bound metal-dependent hydrolase [Methanoregula boonei 6A8]
MDSLTHALVAAALAYAAGLPHLLPFFVLGAVIIDADVLFSLFSRNTPSLYLFIHGGIAHSLTGAVVMSALAYAGIVLATIAGLIPPALSFGFGPAGAAAVLTGAFLHLAMDLPASPGIPLLAPHSDKKYALFVLPGPSFLLMALSLFFLIWMALGVVTFAGGMAAYMAIFCVFLLVRAIAFCLSRPELRDVMLVLPQPDPRRWLALYDRGEAWEVKEYRMGRGSGASMVWQKYRGTTAAEIAPYLALPELKRLRYHSYLLTVEKENGALVFSDPLRVYGRIFYPPHYKQVRFNIP